VVDHFLCSVQPLVDTGSADLSAISKNVQGGQGHVLASRNITSPLEELLCRVSMDYL
jgi:hypothetical protein